MFGLSGPVLTNDERLFFKDCQPWGFSLFSRNIVEPDQVYALTQSLKDLLGRDAPIFIDQEGGRVQRLRGSDWRSAPAAGQFSSLWDVNKKHAIEAVRLNYQLIAHDMVQVGLSGNYAPCLDLNIPQSHDIISDRAFHGRSDAVIDMGAAALRGLNDQGVLGVIKHMPGHGRAMVDSHFELPVISTNAEILTETDFACFAGLSDSPIAMTAHVVFSQIDRDACVTFSRHMIESIIRGEIGFNGLLLSDDISMKALSGSMGERTAHSLSAGCDIVLHCNGVMGEMIEIAHEGMALDHDRARRADHALGSIKEPGSFDAKAALQRLERLFKDANLELIV